MTFRAAAPFSRPRAASLPTLIRLTRARAWPALRHGAARLAQGEPPFPDAEPYTFDRPITLGRGQSPTHQEGSLQTGLTSKPKAGSGNQVISNQFIF